jgi:hypothetical protein
MDVGAKLWIFFLGGVLLVGAGWLLWARFIGFPTHDPTRSPSQPGDPSAIDPPYHDPGNHPPA